jgi:hypothetical protein
MSTRAWWCVRNSGATSDENKEGEDQNIKWEDHLELKAADFHRSLGDAKAFAREATQVIFNVDSSKTPAGFDMAELKDYTKGNKARVASRKCDNASVAATMLLRIEAFMPRPFERVGYQWASCVLGGRGHFYHNARTKMTYVSFGFETHGALLWGPVPSIMKNDGTDVQEFFDVRSVVMEPLWAFLFHVDSPHEDLKSCAWTAVPTTIKTPDDVARFNLQNHGLWPTRAGMDRHLIVHALLEGIPISTDCLKKLNKEFDTNPTVLSGDQGVTLRALVVSLVKFVFRARTTKDCALIAFKYLQSIGQKNADINEDSLDFLHVLEHLDDDRKAFETLEKTLQTRRLTQMAEAAQKHVQEVEAKDPKLQVTPRLLDILKPPGKCSIYKDLAKKSYEVEYEGPVKGKVSGKFLWSKAKPECLAAYQMVDHLWNAYKDEGGDKEGKPSFKDIDDILAQIEAEAGMKALAKEAAVPVAPSIGLTSFGGKPI